MSVPAAFQTVIDGDRFKIARWLEIEGIPYAYGTLSQTSGFFSARAAADRFLAIRPQLANVPRNLDQQVDTLKGGALTVGAIDFEINDDDAQPTLWTGIGNDTDVLHLNGAISKTEVNIRVYGSLASYAAGDYIYIGTETIQIGTIAGQILQNCVRGLFRSTAQAFASAFPVSKRPYTMANRRAWYMEVAINLDTTSVFDAAETNACTRFAGICRGYRLKDGSYGTYVLSVESMDRELDRPCFRNFRSFKLSGNIISDGKGKDGNTQVVGWPGYTTEYDKLYNFDARNFDVATGEFHIVRIDDEFFLGYMSWLAGSTTVPAFRLYRRALFGSQPSKHEEGAMVREIVPVIKNVSDYNIGPTECYVSKFASVPTTNSPLQADHPLLLVLQVLLSTGEATWSASVCTPGTNVGLDPLGAAQRNYDVLPENWGMGVDVSRVNIEEIEAAAAEEPTLRFCGVIDAPINFLDFIRETLAIAGYYYVIEIGDKFTIKRLRPPLPDVSALALSNSTNIRRFFTKWDANWGGAVKEVHFKFNWDVIAQKFRQVTILILGDANVYSKGLARTLEYESRFLYLGKTGTPGELGVDQFDVDQWLLTRKDFYQTRYGRPPPVIRVRVDYSYLDVNYGDIVALTATNVPNIATGEKGLTSAVGEVIGKAVDEASKTIDFTILMTGWRLGYYRFIAPALKIRQQDDVSWYWAESNYYTEAAGPSQGAAQYDSYVEKTDGTMAQPIPDGSPVYVYTPDFSVKQAATLMSCETVPSVLVDGPYLKLDPSGGAWDAGIGGGGGPTAGYHIVFAGYDAVLAATPASILLYAFLSDTNDQLGTANAVFHRLFSP